MLPFASVIMNAVEETQITGDPRRVAESMEDAALNGIGAGERS
jgi:hypothetical protein